MVEVFDRHLERETLAIEEVPYRIPTPIAETIFHIPMVASRQQIRIPMLTLWPVFRASRPGTYSVTHTLDPETVTLEVTGKLAHQGTGSFPG